MKNLDVKIPIGKITYISCVSGSGKSTLANVISETCSAGKPIHCKSYSSPINIKHSIRVNRQPIGKNPRSMIISYLGIYDAIRDLFAETDDAKKLNISASMFSVNVSGGRCETCLGSGKKKIELSYLPDYYIECPDCHGKNFGMKFYLSNTKISRLTMF